MRILRRAGARATFFLVGRNLASSPAYPRQELALAALGDHTWTHPVLTALPQSQMAAEISRTQAAIERLVHQPVRLFRPPYGRHSAAVDAEARSLGMLEVLWSIDSRDSEGADYLGIARRVAAGVRPGSIILLHENRGQTIRALKFHILPLLEKRGLRAVSVPELLALDPPTKAQLRRGLEGCR
jgi:peptidoglycan/xylan/chitin deacetylase (PgdA/CDA1 family)